MTGEFSLAGLTSQKGWVRTRCDLRIWIPVPAGFSPETGLDRDTWAVTMAEAWWEQSGLRYGPDMVAKLAVMLETSARTASRASPATRSGRTTATSRCRRCPCTSASGR